MRYVATFEHGKKQWCVQLVEFGSQPIAAWCESEADAEEMAHKLNFTYHAACAKQIMHSSGVEMTLIGGWSDLAAYYAGSDGNAWSHQGSWSNCGPIEDFKDRVRQGKVRGAITPQ